jgi:hypothetical protein
MKVKAIFKGVTYESLSDSERVAVEKIPVLDALHEEFEAVKSEGQ